MKRQTLSVAIMFFLALAWSLPESSEAKRFGGGRSFGSKPQYRQAAPNSGLSSQQRPQTPQGGMQNPAINRPGLFGGMGGMIGGMLMGGFIGSLLFGGGGHAGPGLLDLVLVGGGLFLLLRFLRGRKAASQAAPWSFQPPGASPNVETFSSSNQIPPPLAKTQPPDFDEREFLEGAKAAYIRLQSSWDKRDLNDIRQFTTPAMWEEMKNEAASDPNPGKTDIVYVNASLTQVEKIDGDIVASVLFDALLRETPDQQQPENVREIWHFTRKEKDPGSFWLLEGIQQVTA